MKNVTNLILKLILIQITLFTSNKNLQPQKPTTSNIGIAKLFCDTSEDKDQSIKALSYNVWGLPIALPGHDQSNRFKQISDSILVRDFEIICLQEVFNPKIRSHLINKLASKYFTASDYSCNQSILGSLIQKDCYGGLMTLSKFPIIEETFFKFSSIKGSSLIEKIGSKGFLFSTIQWNGQLINIINTHLYAGNSQKAAYCRMNQILEMEKILQELESFKKYPTFLFGDLNIVHPDIVKKDGNFKSTNTYNYLNQKMEFIDNVTKLDERSYTVNADINAYVLPTEKKQKLDYIMFHEPAIRKNCIWLSEQEVDFCHSSALSDHLGWKASINIEPIEVKNTTKPDIVNKPEGI